MNLLVHKIGMNKARYIEDFRDVVTHIVNHTRTGDIIIVFGAGESYKLAQDIASKLTSASSIFIE